MLLSSLACINNHDHCVLCECDAVLPVNQQADTTSINMEISTPASNVNHQLQACTSMQCVGHSGLWQNEPETTVCSYRFCPSCARLATTIPASCTRNIPTLMFLQHPTEYLVSLQATKNAACCYECLVSITTDYASLIVESPSNSHVTSVHKCFMSLCAGGAGARWCGTINIRKI